MTGRKRSATPSGKFRAPRLSSKTLTVWFGVWGLGLDANREQLVIWEAVDAEVGLPVLGVVAHQRTVSFTLTNEKTKVYPWASFSVDCCNNKVRDWVLANAPNASTKSAFSRKCAPFWQSTPFLVAVL